MPWDSNETNKPNKNKTNKTNTTQQTKQKQNKKIHFFLGPDNLHILFLVLYGHYQNQSLDLEIFSLHKQIFPKYKK